MSGNKVSDHDNDMPIARGLSVVRGHVKSLSNHPGVYRMIAENGEVLYVGKAKALKKRVSSYTQFDKLPIRLQRMVALTRKMEFIVTHTEAEALLLESNLIKKLKPRYNILLRDDKSFPYILIREDHDFPQILKHRGAHKTKGLYFGPFAGAGDVNRTIAVLQRAFLLRNCSDSVFAQRSRPCLQYHIKRCTAPCVGKVSKQEYAQQVAGARDFMQGKSRDVQEQLQAQMQEASAAMAYEEAASLRDRLRALASIQARQDINIDVGDADVLALYQKDGQSCVQVFFFRGGQNFGNRSYFPRHDKEETTGAVLSAFIAQFYQDKPVPRLILVSDAVDEHDLLEETLSGKAERKVEISCPARGKRRRLVEFVMQNAQQALMRHDAAAMAQEKLLRGVAALFGMDEPPKRIEVYDNSHISGTNMVGAMIVADSEGLRKKAYRKFNIRQAQASDDYGMMREVLTRRFKRALQEDGTSGEDWPDLLLIDGGAGQLSASKEVLEELGVLDRLTVVAIAKGEDRNAGRERFFMVGRTPFQLPVDDPVLHYLQRLRDEAHRFAITTHRARRQKQMSSSPLDGIPGIGAKRKKALLLYFGSARGVADAGVEDLQKVEGISHSVAQKIYDYFHVD